MGRPSRLSQSHSIAHSRRSLSQSSTASARSSHTEPAPKSETPVPPERPTSAATNTTNATESTVPSESTLRAEAEQQLDADNEVGLLRSYLLPIDADVCVAELSSDDGITTQYSLVKRLGEYTTSSNAPGTVIQSTWLKLSK